MKACDMGGGPRCDHTTNGSPRSQEMPAGWAVEIKPIHPGEDDLLDAIIALPTTLSTTRDCDLHLGPDNKKAQFAGQSELIDAPPCLEKT